MHKDIVYVDNSQVTGPNINISTVKLHNHAIVTVLTIGFSFRISRFDYGYHNACSDSATLNKKMF